MRLAVDSRYARIMHVMRDSEQRRPALRRLGDTLGAWYTPLAVAIAVGAWVWTGDPVRFLAVLESHRASLETQQADIEAQLSEIAAFEARIRKQLKSRAKERRHG